MNYLNHDKVEIQKCVKLLYIFKSSNKWIFFLFIYFFYNSFFTYMKMSKNSSARYYPDNKKDCKKGLVKNIKVFLKKKKKESNNMAVNDIKSL